MIHSHLTHVKLLSSILIGFLITRDLITYVQFGCCFGLIKKLFSVPKFEFTKGFIHNLLSRFRFILSQCIIWTFVLNSSLIVIVNPSLLNPGPLHYLKVAAINCQGLIPFKELSSDHPSLDIPKMAELNSYLATHNSDILMLNETWLKKSIKKSELFPADIYKTFRLDRSDFTHPIDPNNPSKFRRNGGGVLIAIPRDIDVKSNKVEFKFF